MPCPASGAISLASLHAEFSGGYSLSSYYRGGAYVTSNNTNVPTSGAISLSNFYSAVKYVPGFIAWGAAGSYSQIIPAGVTTVYVTATGAGGGGGGYGANPGGNWFYSGGGGGGCISYGIAVVAGDIIAVSIGAGGLGAGCGGTAGADTVIYKNGSPVLTLGGGQGGLGNGVGGSGPLVGESTGYAHYAVRGGYSGAVADAGISITYGSGGVAAPDNAAGPGICGYVRLVW